MMQKNLMKELKKHEKRRKKIDHSGFEERCLNARHYAIGTASKTRYNDDHAPDATFIKELLSVRERVEAMNAAEEVGVGHDPMGRSYSVIHVQEQAILMRME